VRSETLGDAADGRVVETDSVADLLKRVAVNAQRIVDALVARRFVGDPAEELRQA
jgi:hypothetical protein